MFFSIDSVDIASYADDNTPYTTTYKWEVENKLEIVSVKLFKWFLENGMKANQGKCHFLSSLDITTKLSLPECSVMNSIFEKLLGVINDRKLNFNEHVTNLCVITQVRKFKHS